MRKKILLGLPLAVLSVFGITSCGSKSESQTSIVTTTTTTVEEVKLSSITLNTSAAKTNYYVGQEIDLSGLKVIANYTDGTTKEVNDYTVNYVNYDTSIAGDYYIRILYTEDGVTKQKSLHISNVSVLANANYIVGITATGAKSEYSYQEEFSTEGLEVKAYYKDGSSKVLNSNEYTVDSSAFDSNKRGDYEIVVKTTETYSNSEASESVSVETCFFASVKLSLKKITWKSGTYKFYQYDDLSIDDWRFTLEFDEGVTEEISTGFVTDIATVIPSTNTSTDGGYKTINVSYTYNGKTVTTTRKVTVLPTSSSLVTGLLEEQTVSNNVIVNPTFELLSGCKVVANSASCGGQAFVKSIELNGIGTLEEHSIKLTLTAGAIVQVVASSQEGSTIGLYNNTGNIVNESAVGTTPVRYTFRAAEAGTYYIWGAGDVSVYFIGVWND